MNRIYYLMGKSSSGKDSIYRSLLRENDLKLSPMVIYTTRPIRSGEREGVEYHFTDEKGLCRMQEEGRVIELRQYNTVHGIWNYFTVDDFSGKEEHSGDGSVGDGDSGEDFLGIGTLESFMKIRGFYGEDRVIPLYVEVEDGLRLFRALERERAEESPKYEEMCRRFLADQQDFSEEKIAAAGIGHRFSNNGALAECLAEIRAYISESQGRSF